MNAIVTWAKGAIGRISAVLGIGLTYADGLDIAPIKEPLEHVITPKGVSILIITLFAISFLRHRHAAKQVRDLKQQVSDLQDAHEELKAQVAGQ